MKKLLLFSMMCLMALSMQAQRCAVLEFKARVGISQSDVDGISAIFTTYFRPSGYTMVERSQIDKVIDEQGFQRSSMTESQMVRIGKILNVSKIVVGDINVVMGQYNVDVRVINVETGTIAATEGATFATSSYRASMQNVATKLAAKIAIKPGTTVSASSSAQKKRTSVEILYGYLKIFPNELGEFSSEPTSVISQINSQAQHGYNNWRIPTNEELSLLKANNYLGNGKYMTRESRNGIVLLVTDGKDYATLQVEEQERNRIQAEQEQARIREEQARIREEQLRKAKEEKERIEKEKQERQKWLNSNGLVDLGLPSGTLWKNRNEEGCFSYKQAVNKFGDKLPTKEQFEELKSKCQWSWNGSGYTVTGPNGNSIVLPAAGWRDYRTNNVGRVGFDGIYWSSTSPVNSDYAYCLMFYSSVVSVCSWGDRDALSVRLVHD